MERKNHPLLSEETLGVLLQQTTNALGITHNGEHNYSEVEDNQKLSSVPRLGLRFFLT